MRGPNKIFGLFCKINGQNILFGPLISENSIVTPPLGATSEESSSCCKCNTYLAVVALLKNSNFKLLPTSKRYVPTSFAASKLLRDVLEDLGRVAGKSFLNNLLAKSLLQEN